jgi:hypothetical protein
MNRSQPWLDTISLLAGGNVNRPTRPVERLDRQEKWRTEKHNPQRLTTGEFVKVKEVSGR